MFYSILSYLVLFYSVFIFYSALFSLVPHYAVYYVVFYSFLFCFALFCSVFIFYSALFSLVLFCSILFFFMLFCSVLYSVLIFYSMLLCFLVMFCSLCPVPPYWVNHLFHFTYFSYIFFSLIVHDRSLCLVLQLILLILPSLFPSSPSITLYFSVLPLRLPSFHTRNR